MKYRIEGRGTTRWYAFKRTAIDAYNRRHHKHGVIHCPGDVNGDTWERSGERIVAIHGVRDGHATVTLRIRES